MIYSAKKDPASTRHIVNVDAYGNAIPNTPSLRQKKSSLAARVVGQREVIVKSKSKEAPGNNNQLMLLTMRLFNKPAAKDKPLVIDRQHGKQEIAPYSDNVSNGDTIIAIPEFVENSMQKLHDEFQRREQHLEKRFEALKSQFKQRAKQKSRWLIPLALTGALGGGYVLYVLTSMQQAMAVMSKSIPAMNQHMSNMAYDTRNMSANMQVMNHSMHALNGNVNHMNQQMGTVSRAMKPMGKAAGFMGMFRKFMPF